LEPRRAKLRNDNELLNSAVPMTEMDDPKRMVP